MALDVLIQLKGIQQYDEQPPDIIELTTEGKLWREDGKLLLSYEETELTGLAGTTTTFEVENGLVRLRRTGTASSLMEFALGTTHKSLYETPMGALLITVAATRIENNLDEHGGNLTVCYDITIEDLGMGQIESRLIVTPL